MNTCFDALIVGGGLVGASLALALARQGRQVALIEGQQPPLTGLDRPDDWDPRVYAISPANQAFLQGLHAWPDASRLGVVAGMDVRGDRHGRIAFHAADAGQPALAWIAENRWLLAALWQQLADSPAQCIAGVRPTAISQHPRHVSLTLDDGRSLNTRLLIGADGANSWVRQQTGIRVDVSPYGHSGVVANFVAERDHGNIARQWFLGDGILAWLPLPGQRISMVWSTSKPEALTALDAATLCDTVAQAGGRELGGFSLLTPAHAFPLRLMRPDSVVAPRIALVGDAELPSTSTPPSRPPRPTPSTSCSRQTVVLTTRESGCRRRRWNGSAPSTSERSGASVRLSCGWTWTEIGCRSTARSSKPPAAR